MAMTDEILRVLSALPSGEILGLMDHDMLLRLAQHYYEILRISDPDVAAPSASIQDGTAVAATASQGASSNTAEDRAKRPLNAFMAFRTYYLKLFPEIQQKTVSGFLTTLWSKDPDRNKWALIAKVYSFVRDDIGKGKVSLGTFLKFACPLMKMIDPGMYLESLCWTLRDSNDGTKLVQDAGASNRMAHLQAEECPNTELELMVSLVNAGYLPEHGHGLLNRMATNASGLMTTAGGLPYTLEKLTFINTLRLDPIQATRELLGDDYDNRVFEVHGIARHRVIDISNINHLPMQPVYPDPAVYYNYTAASIVPNLQNPLHLNSITEYNPVELSNPFDMDVAMGHSQQEGERTADEVASPDYDPYTDFHYNF